MPRAKKTVRNLTATPEQVAQAERPLHLPADSERAAKLFAFQPEETVPDSLPAKVVPLVLALDFKTDAADIKVLAAIYRLAKWDIARHKDFDASRCFSEKSLTAWQKSYANERGVSVSTLGTYKSYIRRVAVANGLRDDDLGRTTNPRRHARRPAALKDWAELHRDAMKLPKPYSTDVDMLADLSFGAGLRLDEISKATGAWVSWTYGGAVITVPNKQGVIRSVPVGPTVAQRLRDAQRGPNDHLVRPGVSRHNLLPNLVHIVRKRLPKFDIDCTAARHRYVVNLLDSPIHFSGVAYLADINPGSHLVTDLVPYCKPVNPAEIHALARGLF